MKLTEIERKYDVDRSLRVPDLSQLPLISGLDYPGSTTLTAVYFDTLGLDLARRRIALRRREGGADAGWHIKLPAEEGRTELQWPLDADGSVEPADTGKVPAAVLDPVRSVVRDRPLTPLARITTIRTTVLLLNDAGDPVAELADDDVSASDMRGGVFRKWREWEVELFSAAPDTTAERTRLLDAIESALIQAGATRSTSPAKIARALGARGLGPVAADADADAETPTPTLAPIRVGSVACVIAALRQQQSRLLAADPAVRASEPGAVTSMLRAVRRLQNVLGVYGALFDRSAVHGLEIDLTALAAVLTAVRHAEQRQRRIDRMFAALPPLAALPSGETPEAAREHVRAEAELSRAAAHAQAVDLLSLRQYYGLLDDLDRFLAAPPTLAAGSKADAVAVRSALRASVATLRERVGAVRQDPADRQERGQAVAAAQRVRHAADALVIPVTGHAETGRSRSDASRYRRLAKAARRAENALGVGADSDGLAAYLDELAVRAHRDSGDTLTIGLNLGLHLGLYLGLLIGLLTARADCADAHARPDLTALADAVRRCRTLVRKL